MTRNLAEVLGVLYAVSEIGLSIFKRAQGGVRADRGSLPLIWLVILVSVGVAYGVAYRFPGTHLGASAVAARHLGVLVYAAGLCLRWYSIFFLGRFFTVNVAIVSDHQLISTGPYRYVRHPSYTGALLAFLGLGLCIGNWLSILLLIVPIFLVFLRRMHVEEAALVRGLGEPYREYMRHTKRLVPALY